MKQLDIVDTAYLSYACQQKCKTMIPKHNLTNGDHYSCFDTACQCPYHQYDNIEEPELNLRYLKNKNMIIEEQKQEKIHKECIQKSVSLKRKLDDLKDELFRYKKELDKSTRVLLRVKDQKNQLREKITQQDIELQKLRFDNTKIKIEKNDLNTALKRAEKKFNKELKSIKKVELFTIFIDYDYEGRQLIGIFDTEQEARDCAKKYTKETGCSLEYKLSKFNLNKGINDVDEFEQSIDSFYCFSE